MANVKLKDRFKYKKNNTLLYEVYDLQGTSTATPTEGVLVFLRFIGKAPITYTVQEFVTITEQKLLEFFEPTFIKP